MDKKVAIVIPGLGDGRKDLSAVAKWWQNNNNWKIKYGIETNVIAFGWADSPQTLNNKLIDLNILIDNYYKANYKITLIGTSAGASAVFNAYYESRNKVGKLINVCGRLREGVNVTPTLDQASRRYPLFKESVKKCEAKLNSLNREDLDKVLTVRAVFDEVVPSNTVILEGATNIVVSSVEHVLTIGLVMSVFSNRVARFIYA